MTASICLLTQLVESVELSVGRRHPVHGELCLRVRDQHLRALHASVQPGGTIVLVTDIVSSDSCQALLSTPAVDIPRLVSQQINERNFFTGANPFAIQAFYREDPVVSRQIDQVEVSLPWLWNLGSRVYAVAAIVVDRVK